MESKKSLTFELNRQIFHLFLGITIVFLLSYGLFHDITVFGIIIRYADIPILIIFGLLSSFLSRKVRIPIIYNLLQKFEREKEIKAFPGKGIIFYLIGVYASLSLFPQDIAKASIMILALGDSISHICGLHYGRIKYPLSNKKFLEGTIAGFVAGFLGAKIFLTWHEAFLASLAAMIVEAIEIKIGTEQVDDNLIIPVIAGSVVWVVRLI